MKGFGVHYTLDEGQSWHAAAGVGLDGEPRALAAHPYAAGTVAIGTTEGVFLSRDFGGRFEGLARDVQGLALQFDLDGERLRGEDRPKAKELGLALHFDLDGERLWLGSFAGTAYLARIDLRSGTIEPAPTPHWGQDPVSYIAQNPASRTEYAIATLGRSVYLSKNGARTWTQIADRGRVR